MSNKKTVQVPKFDNLWHDALKESGNLATGTRKLVSGVRAVRRAAYRFAWNIMMMQKHYHNKLLDMIHSEGKSIETWMNENFELIEHMNETRQRIFAAIESGVTEKEYVERGEIVLGQKRVKATRKLLLDTPLPPLPKEPKSPEDTIDDLIATVKSYASINQGLKSALRDMTQNFERADRRINMLEKSMKRMKKETDKAILA